MIRLLDKLQAVEEHFAEIEARLGDPSVVADVAKFTALTRELATLEPITNKIREYKKILAQIDEDKNLLETSTDEDLKILAAEELVELKNYFLDIKFFKILSILSKRFFTLDWLIPYFEASSCWVLHSLTI